MTTKAETIERKHKELRPTTLHESICWDEDSPKWKYLHREYKPDNFNVPVNNKPSHVIDMGTDSYIWCFSGTRGAGKTTLMTMFAIKVYWLYKYRIIANYPIEFYFQRMHGKPEYVKSEPLDLYKLLCFDNDYHDCLILIDEAPDIVSHLASMTWKNKLMNIFIRQLRKNHNSLFLGAQQFEIIDKSMRWQTDILVECQDASRKYGWPASERGKLILANLLDNSGMWTGETWEETQYKNRHRFSYEDPGEKLEIYPRVLWGTPGETKPVYDTYFTQDVFESLRKVDMKLGTYKVGENENEDVGSQAYVKKAVPVIESAIESQSKDNVPGYYSKDFYAMVGTLSTTEKDKLSKRLNRCGVKIGSDHKGKRFYDFSEFDLAAFKNNS